MLAWQQHTQRDSLKICFAKHGGAAHAVQVIDECHHSYNDHPFNDVLAFYRQQNPAEQQNTQVRPAMSGAMRYACIAILHVHMNMFLSACYERSAF